MAPAGDGVRLPSLGTSASAAALPKPGGGEAEVPRAASQTELRSQSKPARSSTKPKSGLVSVKFRGDHGISFEGTRVSHSVLQEAKSSLPKSPFHHPASIMNLLVGSYDSDEEEAPPQGELPRPLDLQSKLVVPAKCEEVTPSFDPEPQEEFDSGLHDPECECEHCAMLMLRFMAKNLQTKGIRFKPSERSS
ncbi:unnamed protein product [Symbiodinium natans]|uniref:Uncharacterized protein n=1 Tax=Symbiodinium natans TaxID=878477 RepID=A0A812LZM1_9DINO|nr:unnamed protein product [Symbiodinium natans]